MVKTNKLVHNLRSILLVGIFAIILTFSSSIYAAAGYEFKLEYEGNIIENQEKAANVILQGTNATPYSNVRIKLEFVSGPATPKIMATDSNGTDFDLENIGYWGPPSGFAVGGDFENKTAIRAVYPKAGTYVSRLSLVDVNNNEAVISSNEFTVTVLAAQAPVNNTVNNTIDNTINNLPQTGTSIFEYAILAIILVGIVYVVYSLVRKR